MPIQMSEEDCDSKKFFEFLMIFLEGPQLLVKWMKKLHNLNFRVWKEIPVGNIALPWNI